MMQPMRRNIIVIQPALPAYRIDFFKRLAEYSGDSFHLYYSTAALGILTDKQDREEWSTEIGRIRSLLPGMEWQHGALGVPIHRGDIVVISGAPRCISNLALLVRARWVGAKTVWWGHYWSATSKKHRFLLRLLLMKLAHGLLFYTDEEVATYRNSYGKNDTRPVSALNNGLNIDPIKALRAPYDPAVRGNTLLFIGRLTEKANLALLLRALAQPALATAKLHVIGGGEKEGGYKRLAVQLDIEDRVVWHGGTTNEQDIAHVANQCALFVYPGAVGLSLIHAMAYGLPAIVHNRRSEHMPEISAFKENITGNVFERANANSLAASLGTMLNEKTKLEFFSRSSVARVDSKFSTKTMSERLISIVKIMDHIK